MDTTATGVSMGNITNTSLTPDGKDAHQELIIIHSLFGVVYFILVVLLVIYCEAKLGLLYKIWENLCGILETFCERIQGCIRKKDVNSQAASYHSSSIISSRGSALRQVDTGEGRSRHVSKRSTVVFFDELDGGNTTTEIHIPVESGSEQSEEENGISQGSAIEIEEESEVVIEQTRQLLSDNSSADSENVSSACDDTAYTEVEDHFGAEQGQGHTEGTCHIEGDLDPQNVDNPDVKVMHDRGIQFPSPSLKTRHIERTGRRNRQHTLRHTYPGPSQRKGPLKRHARPSSSKYPHQSPRTEDYDADCSSKGSPELTMDNSSKGGLLNTGVYTQTPNKGEHSYKLTTGASVSTKTKPETCEYRDTHIHLGLDSELVKITKEVLKDSPPLPPYPSCLENISSGYTSEDE